MEKIRPNTPERGHENAAIEKAAAERLGQLENREQQAESNKHEVEAARETIRKTETMPMPGESEARPTAPTHILSPAQNYKNTMAGLQHRMKPAARTFSKFIHTPAVERSSEFVGKTVLRPSVTLRPRRSCSPASFTFTPVFTGLSFMDPKFGSR
jgi:hypothetical protein